MSAIVARLRLRRGEIEEAVFDRVRAVEPESAGLAGDVEYVEGLREAVVGAVEFALAGLEWGEGRAGEVPEAAVVQARRAVRGGVRLGTVLRRYRAGNTVLGEFTIEEVADAGVREWAGVLGGLLGAQALLVERLMSAIAQEYELELERAGRSREHRRLEVVRGLLAGEGNGAGSPQGGGSANGGGAAAELGYAFEAEHVGVVAHGVGAHGAGADGGGVGVAWGGKAADAGVAGVVEALRDVARALDRRLLCVRAGEGTVWAWLAGKRGMRMGDLERAVSGALGRLGDDRASGAGGRAGHLGGGVWIALGEPAWGLEGWRLTHRQAQAAAMVAARGAGGVAARGSVSAGGTGNVTSARSAGAAGGARGSGGAVTRYGDVALLACALKDEGLARALIEVYIAPLDEARGESSGVVLRQTLRAYLVAECNVTSAAAALGVVRQTVVKRLQAIEEQIGRSLHPCPAELEVALELDEIGIGVRDGEGVDFTQRNLRVEI